MRLNPAHILLAAAVAAMSLSVSAAEPGPETGSGPDTPQMTGQPSGQRPTQMTPQMTGRKRYGQTKGQAMRYIVEGGDTIYVAELPAARVYEKLPKQKGREWRKYYRLVYNFSKTYPYALVARKLVQQADSTIAHDKLKRGKKEKYVNEVQDELFSVFEKPLKNLTVSQGAMLMKLIDREVGKTSYLIIKDYKNGMAAGFWQGIAKLFGTDLKKPYDPDGEDEALEELVQKWESGEFEGLYYSLFWEYPAEVEIPEKYR